MRSGSGSWLGSAVVAMLLAAASVASAQQTPLAAARRHYQALEYDQALASLADARRGAATPAQLNEVMLLEAFVQVALDRRDEALGLFRQVLRNDPSQKLSANISPKLTTLFEQARTLEQERARHRSEVGVVLRPPASPEVASRTVDVAVVVTHPFPTLGGRLVIEDAQTHARVQIALQPELDGTWRARIPAALVQPNADLSLRAELVHEGDVIASGPAKDAAVHLMVPGFVAALRIESPLLGAVVRIDGREVGRIPIARLVPVTAGRRHVEVASDKGTIVQDVEVVPGEVARVSLTVSARPRLPIVRYFLIGLGSALLVTGGVLFDQSQRADAQYHALIARSPVTGLPTNEYTTAAPQAESTRAFQIAASVAVAVGGAAALVGLGLFAVRGHGADRRLALGAAGVGVRF